MKIEISNGELIDRITILELKMLHIKYDKRRAGVRAELEALSEQVHQDETLLAILQERGGLYQSLLTINQAIWDIENQLRARRERGELDVRFAELASAACGLNDQRFAVKREINELTGSALHEEKQYTS
jgi:hypothetical protein